jgi:predicted metal-dependent phosphoesterase TrpH
MVVAQAVKLGLRVIAITDHDSIDGALEASQCDPAHCEVVIGEEVTSRQGHVLGLYLSRRVAAGLDVAETIEEIHAQGGLAIPAHPFLQLGGARGVGSRFAGLPWDAIETENGSPGAWFANRQARRAHAAWARAQTGGSDAHILSAIGSVVTVFGGASAADLRAAIASGTTRAERRNRSPLIGVRTMSRSLRRKLSGEAGRELLSRGSRSPQP